METSTSTSMFIRSAYIIALPIPPPPEKGCENQPDKSGARHPSFAHAIDGTAPTLR
jgi:hypothetical protein